jgi:hypothetical protein
MQGSKSIVALICQYKFRIEFSFPKAISNLLRQEYSIKNIQN